MVMSYGFYFQLYRKYLEISLLEYTKYSCISFQGFGRTFIVKGKNI